MSEDFLKGNFSVKNPVVANPAGETLSEKERLERDLRKKVLTSLGGSMVYVERSRLSWEGEEGSTPASAPKKADS